MNVSELIDQLEQFRAKHGDLPVFLQQSDRRLCLRMEHIDEAKSTFGQTPKIALLCYKSVTDIRA